MENSDDSEGSGLDDDHGEGHIEQTIMYAASMYSLRPYTYNK